MKRGLIGEYRITPVDGEKIRAFVLKPWPPNPPLRFTSQRQRLLERATLAVGWLDSITLLLPNPDIFLHTYVCRKALFSSQIEDTRLPLSDLLLFELEEAPGVPLDGAVVDLRPLQGEIIGPERTQMQLAIPLDF